VPEVLNFVGGRPEFAGVNATLDGLVEVTPQAGPPLKVRPDFEVTRGHPAGDKRIIVEGDGSRAFDFGDVRRQRFRIVP
jgi:hypothetical protein